MTGEERRGELSSQDRLGLLSEGMLAAGGAPWPDLAESAPYETASRGSATCSLTPALLGLQSPKS